MLARTYDGDGLPIGTEFEVSTPGTDDSLEGRAVAGVQGLDVAATAPDRFVYVWTSGGFYRGYGGSFDGDGVGVFTRDFDAVGKPLGVERQANALERESQVRPALAFGTDERGMVVWQRSDTAAGRLFDRIDRACGDANEDGEQTSADALLVLRAAVGGGACEACTCDADGSAALTVRDALMVLKSSVGQVIAFDCPVCPEALGQD